MDDPRGAFFYLIEKFFDQQTEETTSGVSGDPSIYRIHSFISSSASIGKRVQIGAGCVIEGNVVIGDYTVIHHNVVIRNGTKIGKNCTIFSGAKIGERGYNFFTTSNGEKQMFKHYGGVTIGERVHIGENVCISRGAIDDTKICDGVKIDALVHIAHNCVIGKNTAILVPTSVSGSVEIGEDCHIAANMIAFGNPAKPVRFRRDGE